MITIQPEIWGWVSLAIAVVSYVPYFAGIFAGRTKPHAFSWIIWCLLAIFAFFGQREAGAGAGAWINELIAGVCCVISVIALVISKQNVTKSDWIAFIAALLIIPVWKITASPLYAMLMIAAIDTLAFYPTYRKSWKKPEEENSFTYSLNGLQYLASVFAMTNVNWTTTLYPSWMVFLNGAFVGMVLWRKKQITQ